MKIKQNVLAKNEKEAKAKEESKAKETMIDSIYNKFRQHFIIRYAYEAPTGGTQPAAIIKKLYLFAILLSTSERKPSRVPE